MNFVAIEYDNKVNNSHAKGFIRIPNDFHPEWSIGYRAYLCDKYKAENIRIYPLNVQLNSDSMGYNISGFENMEDSFILALRSTEYYPNTNTNAYIRRQWAMLDPTTQSFTVKER